MGKPVPGNREYVDDVSKQDKEEYAAWMKEQGNKPREDDGANEGDFSVEHWLKERKHGRPMLHCEFCKEAIDEPYTVLWREEDGVKVEVAFLHLEHEEDFRNLRYEVYFHEEFVATAPRIHIDPEIAKWKAEHQN